MKTKKVLMTRTVASFSSAATYTSSITLPKAPWEEDDDQVAELAEAAARQVEKVSGGARHLGPYRRDRKNY